VFTQLPLQHLERPELHEAVVGLDGMVVVSVTGVASAAVLNSARARIPVSKHVVHKTKVMVSVSVLL
jgi:hypothetical protein